MDWRDGTLPKRKIHHWIVAQLVTFVASGFKIVSNGTDNHLILVDTKSTTGVTGKEAEEILDKINITVNKNAIPFDTQKPNITSGIRIGTPAMTTRGMKEEEMKEIASLIDRTISGEDKEKIKEDVLKLTSRFPIY